MIANRARSQVNPSLSQRGRFDPISGNMELELSDDEKAALLRELDGIIEDDRYPLSPRIQMLRANSE